MKNIMVIAGEESGDLHGASLIQELKKIDPELYLCGVGGAKMEAAGMELNYHINKMAFLGFVEVLKHLPFIKKVQKDLLKIVKEKNIKNVILIDYPGFNLSMAKKLKPLGVKIFYYISPQVWAWGAGRIKKIRALVDKMIVLFPFEEEMYKKHSVDAVFAGHPLLERIEEYNYLPEEEFYKKFNLNPGKEILLILPGSRRHEVEKIFPAAIKAAVKIADEFNMQIVAACAANIDEELLYSLTGEKSFTVVKGYTYDLFKHAKAGIVKSGTSTLETALFALPMVIVYKTSMLTYLIGKNLAKVKFIGMANIISGELVAPELIQNDFTAENLYGGLKKILSNKNVYGTMKRKLEKVKEKLGITGASRRAAEIIYASLK